MWQEQPDNNLEAAKKVNRLSTSVPALASWGTDSPVVYEEQEASWWKPYGLPKKWRVRIVYRKIYFWTMRFWEQQRFIYTARAECHASWIKLLRHTAAVRGGNAVRQRGWQKMDYVYNIDDCVGSNRTQLIWIYVHYLYDAYIISGRLSWYAHLGRWCVSKKPVPNPTRIYSGSCSGLGYDDLQGQCHSTHREEDTVETYSISRWGEGIERYAMDGKEYLE